MYFLGNDFLYCCCHLGIVYLTVILAQCLLYLALLWHVAVMVMCVVVCVVVIVIFCHGHNMFFGCLLSLKPVIFVFYVLIVMVCE